MVNLWHGWLASIIIHGKMEPPQLPVPLSKASALDWFAHPGAQAVYILGRGRYRAFKAVHPFASQSLEVTENLGKKHRDED